MFAEIPAREGGMMFMINDMHTHTPYCKVYKCPKCKKKFFDCPSKWGGHLTNILKDSANGVLGFCYDCKQKHSKDKEPNDKENKRDKDETDHLLSVPGLKESLEEGDKEHLADCTPYDFDNVD